MHTVVARILQGVCVFAGTGSEKSSSKGTSSTNWQSDWHHQAQLASVLWCPSTFSSQRGLNLLFFPYTVFILPQSC